MPITPTQLQAILSLKDQLKTSFPGKIIRSTFGNNDCHLFYNDGKTHVTIFFVDFKTGNMYKNKHDKTVSCGNVNDITAKLK